MTRVFLMDLFADLLDDLLDMRGWKIENSVVFYVSPRVSAINSINLTQGLLEPVYNECNCLVI